MGDDYMPRHLDEVIRDNLRLFGAVVVTGPKWCGKTTTASRLAKGVISLQDERQYTRYRALAYMDPQLVLSGERPLLIDEWQSIPELWDAARYNVDLSKKKGQFILTGSVSFRMDDDRIRHSGSGRISRIRMRTMTLSESGNSTSEVSLGALFDGCPKVMGLSRLELDDIAGEIVRGGWPETVGLDDMDAHKVVRSYCETLLEGKVDTSDGKVRDIRKMRALMRSLSRNTASQARASTLVEDVNGSGSARISINTVYEYLSHLADLCVTDDLPSWSPKLRSKTTVRTSDTRYLADPAIAAYFLGAGRDDVLHDPETFGLLFETMALRDLRVYAQLLEGEVFHYRDEDGLEVDAVIHLWDGRWGAAEIKLTDAWADKGAENLIRLRDKVDADEMGAPSFLMVVTASGAAYTRPDGIHVVPLACLGNRILNSRAPFKDHGPHKGGGGHPQRRGGRR